MLFAKHIQSSAKLHFLSVTVALSQFLSHACPWFVFITLLTLFDRWLYVSLFVGVKLLKNLNLLSKRFSHATKFGIKLGLNYNFTQRNSQQVLVKKTILII